MPSQLQPGEPTPDAGSDSSSGRAGFALAAVILIVLLGLTVNEFARPRQATSFAPNETPSAKTVQKLPTFKLRIAAKEPLRVFALATRKDEADLVTATLRGRTLRVQSISGYGQTHPPFEAEYPRRPQQLDVGEWSDDVRNALLVAHPAAADRTKTSLHLVDPSGGGRPIVRPLTVALPTPPKGSERLLRLARWDGDLGDLFVIDRVAARKQVRIRVLSGESGFRKVTADFTNRLGTFTDEKFAIDVLPSPGGKRPDLVLHTIVDTTRSKAVDVHVLTGDRQFKEFSIQTPTRFPAAQTDKGPLLLIRERERLMLLAVELDAHLLRQQPVL